MAAASYEIEIHYTELQNLDSLVEGSCNGFLKFLIRISDPHILCESPRLNKLWLICDVIGDYLIVSSMFFQLQSCVPMANYWSLLRPGDSPKI